LQSKQALISAVVPVRDRADSLVRCLESLAAQDFPSESYEIIVCDDGSTADLSGVLLQFQQGFPGIRIGRQERRGPAAARNLGIRSSISPIVLFVDSDVIAAPGLIGSLVDALEKNPDWAGAEARLLPAETEKGPLWEAPESGKGGRFHTAAIAYRKDVLVAAGGLDETFPLPACEDVELAARIVPFRPIGFVPEAVAYHPRRKVGIRMHWSCRLHWKYIVILAKRYGFLAFPERRVGRFSRLRVAFAAVVSLPLGRLLKALRWVRRSPLDAGTAALHALFDIVCGLWALPEILFCRIPARLNYLQNDVAAQPPGRVQQECRP